MSDVDWSREARRVLKAELAKCDASYKTLSRALEELGIEENPKALSTKINRGTFSFAFFLQCMRALRVGKIRLELD